MVAPEADGRLGTRLAALERLGNQMTAEEIAALYDYLRQGIQNEQTLSPQQLHVLVNEILDALVEQELPPPGLRRAEVASATQAGLTEALIAVYRDRSQDAVVRDYTVQHLRRWYERAPDRAAIRPVLWDALTETDSTIAGTALLALERLAETDPEIERGCVAQAALALARDPRVGQPARVTALQVCSQMGVREIVPLARDWAAHGESLALRVSAIAALGQLGGPAERPFLEQLAAGEDARVRAAAQAALKRITTMSKENS